MQALVGREREIDTLNDLLNSVSDHGAALVLRGEAGVGKSALLASASAYASAQGMFVLTATGVQTETQLAFAGLHQLLRPLLAHAEALPAPQRDALHGAFGMHDGTSDEPAPNLFLIALATLELLANAAEQIPLLIIAEDAQWLDGSTVDTLAFVARRVEAEPIVLLLAVRDGAESALLDAGLPELRVEALDAVAASTLLEAHAPGLAAAVRERLLEEAAGNPLALLELPAALQEEQLGGSAPLPPWLPLTTRLERVFGERISRLPEPTRALLLIAALDSGELAEALQAATLLQGVMVSEEALEPVAAAGLAQVEDGLIHFRHPLIRSAMGQAAGSARLRAAHAALAAALAEEPDRSVWHRAAAVVGHDDDVARDLEAVATRAKRRGAQAVAVAALERAVVLSRDSARCGDWLLRAAASAETLGRPDIVMRLLRQAETLELGPRERIWLSWYQEVYTDAVAWSGVERARAFVELAEQAEQAGEVENALRTLELIAFRCFWTPPDPETRRLLLAAVERLPLPAERPALLRVLGYVAPIERGAIVLERLPRAAEAVSGDHVAESELGSLAGAVGDFEQAGRLLATAVAGLRAQGIIGELAHALVFQAWTAICLGNWTVAASAVDEAVRWAQETRQSFWVGGAYLAQAAVAAAQGDDAHMEALAAEAERRILAVGPHSMLSFVQSVRGLVALGQGRHAEAYDQVRRIFDPTDLAYHPQVRFWAATDYLEAAIHSDHLEEARAIVAEMETLVEQTHAPLLRIILAYARPLLADDQEAEALYLASLGEPLANRPFLRARLQLAYGGWLRRHRRMADSRAPLRAAIEVFDALGVTPWAERARQELRASGETSRPRTPEARDQLSPQELQIAQLAADGLSNREIGQRLYLSHRTVGSHLYRLFPKLGITSRSELHAALAGDRK
jgi:DNA-binding CsgD family transcriptional regulator/tetratricopeptide (TPR) repeat protein